MRRISLVTSIVVLWLLAATAEAAPTTPETVEGYLTQLKVKAEKGAPGEFQFKLGFPQAPPEQFQVRVLPEVKIVYVAILDVYQVPAGGLLKEAIFRTLAELNYKLLVGKVEWEPETGKVRLSYTFAGENSVDFASFKSAIQTLLAEVEQVRKALKAIK